MTDDIISKFENPEIGKHKFPSLHDIKHDASISIYSGSRNFFERYDYSKSRISGGALFGLGQYFTADENLAYNYATLDKSAPFIEKNATTNGEKLATQKVVYRGEISTDNLDKILLPELMEDTDYDFLAQIAHRQNKDNLAKELSDIKAMSNDRHIGFYQWLRKEESLDLLQSSGINGIYDQKRGIFAIYNTSDMNVKIKEAIAIDGTEIPASLVDDNSLIHIQKEPVEFPKDAHISTMKGSNLKRVSPLSPKNTLVASIEPGTLFQSVKATKLGAKNGMFEAVRTTDNKINTLIDRTVEKGSTKLNTSKVGKAYIKTKEAVANSYIGRAVSGGARKITGGVAKVFKKTGSSLGKTVAGKAAKKAVAKTLGGTVSKAVGKSVLKKIPIVSLGAGIVLGTQRAIAGDWKGAVGELASGTLGTFPGLGTAASVAIDVGLVGRDIHNEKNLNKQNNVQAENLTPQAQQSSKDYVVANTEQKPSAEAEFAQKASESIKKNSERAREDISKVGGKRPDFETVRNMISRGHENTDNDSQAESMNEMLHRLRNDNSHRITRQESQAVKSNFNNVLRAKMLANLQQQ